MWWLSSPMSLHGNWRWSKAIVCKGMVISLLTGACQVRQIDSSQSVKRRCHFGNVIPASLILSCSSVALWQMIFPFQCRQNVRYAKLIKKWSKAAGCIWLWWKIGPLCGVLSEKTCEMLLDLCDHLPRCKTHLNAPAVSIDELKWRTLRSSTAFLSFTCARGEQKTIILVKELILHYDCVTAVPTFKC